MFLTQTGQWKYDACTQEQSVYIEEKVISQNDENIYKKPQNLIFLRGKSRAEQILQISVLSNITFLFSIKTS
jgi:hypothetical protein